MSQNLFLIIICSSLFSLFFSSDFLKRSTTPDIHFPRTVKAVRSAAWRFPQFLHHPLKPRHPSDHPRRRNRITVIHPDQRQRIGQLCRRFRNDSVQVHISAEFVLKGIPDQIRGLFGFEVCFSPVFPETDQVGCFRFPVFPKPPEKTPERLRSGQQTDVNLFHLRRKPCKGFPLVPEKFRRFLRILQGVVQLAALQLIVLYKKMVWPGRKQ